MPWPFAIASRVPYFRGMPMWYPPPPTDESDLIPFQWQRPAAGSKGASLAEVLSSMVARYRAPYFWRDYDSNPYDNHNWELGFGEKREGYWCRAVVLNRRILLEDNKNILVEMFIGHDGGWIELDGAWRIPLTALRFMQSESERCDPLDDYREPGDFIRVLAVAGPGQSAAREDKATALVPLVSEKPNAAPVKPRPATTRLKFSMTRIALIRAHLHEWPTIERDIKDASTNGLAAAKTGSRHWDEAAALQWARAKGKLNGGTAKPGDALAQSIHKMATLPSKRHSLDG
jgi:hypothetical protein